MHVENDIYGNPMTAYDSPDEERKAMDNYLAGNYGALTALETAEFRALEADPGGVRAAEAQAEAQAAVLAQSTSRPTASLGNLPLDFQHPGGFVEQVMDFINATAVCPQPLFALGAALSLAGILYGRRVQGEDGQRTNLFVMTVGVTSAGKNGPIKAIAGILDAAGATNLRLGQVTSDSAIEWALKREPRQLLLIDEAGYYFSSVGDPSAKASPTHAIKPALLELWSSANSRWKGKQRVPRDGKETPPVEIDQPHLCLYGTTQPQILFESLSRNDLRDGWLSRNLFFISHTRPKPRPCSAKRIPNGILAEVLGWKTPGPLVTVPTQEDARAIFAAFNDRIYLKMLVADKTGDETNYLYGKALENAMRIALILAVSRSGGDGLAGAAVTPTDARYATLLVEYLITEMIRTVRENVSESADEKAKKRMLQIIAHAGTKGVLKGELTRKTQFIRRTFRDEYLADLVESGEIVEIPAETCGSRFKLREYVLGES